MTTSKIRSALLAAATIMTLGGGAAMAAQPNADGMTTAMATTFNQPTMFHASVNKQPLPWYESGFTSRAQLRGQIQSESYAFGDNG